MEKTREISGKAAPTKPAATPTNSFATAATYAFTANSGAFPINGAEYHHCSSLSYKPKPNG